MKTGFTALLLFSFGLGLAHNLVQNGSFEDTVSCPLGGDQLYKAIHWYKFRETPDYFHTCCILSNCVVGVPSNVFGFQYPHSGNAYAGMTTFDLTGAPFHEFLAVQLLSPTIINQKYYA